jgi:hypothetical protein
MEDGGEFHGCGRYLVSMNWEKLIAVLVEFVS